MKGRESAENYLETILVLSLKGEKVRSIDIVNELEYSKPSVSVAMKNLREKGYIVMGDDGYITLTAKGRKIADSMYERHIAISDLLSILGVDKKTAVQDACKMEHAMSEKSFLAIKKHIEYLKQRDAAGGIDCAAGEMNCGAKEIDNGARGIDCGAQ